MRVKGRIIMKKLISFISFVLVIVMLAGPVAAFKDFPGENIYDSDGRWRYYNKFTQQYGWGGYPDGTFKPGEVITRAELASYIYKLKDSSDFFSYGQEVQAIRPVREYKNNFSDVSPNKWYYKAIVWAYECGFVNGVGCGKFDPDSTVTVFEYALVMERFYDAAITDEFKEYTAENDTDWWIEPLSGGKNSNYRKSSGYLGSLSDEEIEEYLSAGVILDPPAWFLKETDLREVLKHDIWIGGDYEHVDMTQFSPTRGELYKHSHAFLTQVFIGS